jgi:hypothetical protein
MSYVFFPPRTSNFYPGGPPYLAGIGASYGTVTSPSYEQQLAAYEADLKKWKLESLNARNAQAVYDKKVKQIDDAYTSALAAYRADKIAWDNQYQAYLVAVKNWDAAFKQYQAANAAKAQQVAAGYGIKLDGSFYNAGACVTQAQHDAYARNCTTVKGLGRLHGLGSSDPDCGMKLIPVCQFGPYPTVRNQPAPPPKGAYPAKPAPVRPMPVAPTPTTVTAPTPTSTVTVKKTPTPVPVSLPVPVPDEALTPTPPAADEPKQANVLMGGLIVAAIAVGGFLVYRTLKKPKAQAA